MTKSRIEAFTDAIIAIVMTVLVLSLHQPAMASFSGLLSIRHKLFIYVISFIMLAIYWNNHHHLFQLVNKINSRVLWANNLFIFTMTLFPFVTAWVGDFIDQLIPQLTYGVVALFANSVYLLLTYALIHANGKDSAVGRLFRRYYKSYISIALNIIALLLGWFVDPYLVLAVNIVVLIIWIVPDRRIEKEYKKEVVRYKEDVKKKHSKAENSDQLLVHKKVVIRKDVEKYQLGEEVYSNDIANKYAIYVIRKFEADNEYSAQDQVQQLLVNLPETFTQAFELAGLKNIYVRINKKAIYLTFLVSFTQPSDKIQNSELRKWMADLELPESTVKDDVRENDETLDLQDATSDLLLSTQGANQSSQRAKINETSPIIKVRKSELIAKKKNSQKSLNNRLKSNKATPVKVIFSTNEGRQDAYLDQQLEQALEKITALATEVTSINQKVVTTAEEVTSITQRFNQLSSKLDVVEETVLITQSSTVALQKEHKQLEQLNAETIELREMMKGLSQKIQTIEVELKNVNDKTQSTYLVDASTVRTSELEPKHHIKQEELLENSYSTRQRLADVENPELSTRADLPQESTKKDKEDGQQSTTRAIENMLDRVSDGTRPYKSIKKTTNASSDFKETEESNAQKIEMEREIHYLFKKNRGFNHKGMIVKGKLYQNIRQLKLLSYLWAKVYRKNQKDLLLNNELSCQELISDIPYFIERLKKLSTKRLVNGRFIYCSKEVEQKLKGYQLLMDYLETYY